MQELEPVMDVENDEWVGGDDVEEVVAQGRVPELPRIPRESDQGEQTGSTLLQTRSAREPLRGFCGYNPEVAQ
jgi:hypothetical protein